MAFRNRSANYPLYETTYFDNTRTLVENVAQRYPDKYAFTFRRKHSDPEPQHLTFRECADYVRDFATELHAEGFCEKTIALIGEASPEWFISYYAVMSMGAVSVPVDKELPVPDMASILNTAECTTAIVSPAIVKKMAEVQTQVPTLVNIIVMGELPADAGEGWRALTDVRALGAEKVAAGDTVYYDYEIDNERLASIVFTSGTTGKGKGVMLSQKNICSDMVQGIFNFQISYRTMFVLPPHHTFGSTVNLIGHYSQGAEIYITSGIRYIMNEIKEYKPEHLVLVPLFVETFYKRIITSADKAGKLGMLKKLIAASDALRKVGIDMRKKLFGSVLENFGGNLNMIICGGAALNQNIIDFFESIGITILNGYGITECAPLISCNRNEYRKTGSVGLPIIGGELKILDPDENGEGEIAYRGPNVMLGYYHNEEATKAVLDEEGWFRTGDYGKIEKEGSDQWLYITGRLKNLIIFSNGKNVYPEEIETEIQGVSGVNEVVVYAGESRRDPGKEVIVAEIYPDSELLASHGVTDVKKYFEEEIRKINARSVSYKAVGLVKLRSSEFPKNTSKKITRFAIDKSID